MIDYRDNEIRVASATQWWSATHASDLFGGPHALWIGGDLVLQDEGLYIDDMVAESAVLEQVRGHEKATGDRIDCRAHFPFGGRIGLSQSCIYGGNHVRVNFDFNWPAGGVVKRHFGIQRLTLPGPWTRYRVIPPALQLSSGAGPQWHAIRDEQDGGGGMLAHWHRPPLALVFERPNGTQLEIGTGSDIWRWENSLEAGEEKGSYKVFNDGGTLQIIREPLMTCDEYQPPHRQYRLKWYAAWATANAPAAVQCPSERIRLKVGTDRKVQRLKSLPEMSCLELDFASFPWPETALRAVSPGNYIRGERAAVPCWEANATRKLARSIIRQLREKYQPCQLVLTGLEPGICWDGSHVNRPHRDGAVHWDISSLLEFCVWARRTLGEGWNVLAISNNEDVLPSVRGLFHGPAD